MTADNDASESLATQVRDAFAAGSALRIVGSDSKFRLGRPVAGAPLDVTAHRGIVAYEPSELVVTARAGTPLAEVEAVLAESGQMFSFEPPHLGETATLGGMMACGLSGPRRPHSCASRDSTLGMKMINGRGDILQFGGQVMKNVAGYDVSRLMVGAQGTLGVLLDVSLKVLPQPAHEATLRIEMDAAAALETMSLLVNEALPLSAACHLPAIQFPAQLYLRLSGARAAVVEATSFIQQELSAFPKPEVIEDPEQVTSFWRDLRERRLDFFDKADSRVLWRLSVPPATPAFSADSLPGECLIDWAGAQRWLKTSASIDVVQSAALAMGGHASRFDTEGVLLSPLNPALAKIHQRVKQAFDPKGILNPGRLYEGL